MFRNTINCTYNSIRLIIYKSENMKVSINYIKKKIYETYQKYPDYINKIVSILKSQGKKKLLATLNTPPTLAVFKPILFSDDYYLTDLDIFAFINNKKNLKVILFSNKTFNTMNSNINWLLIDNVNDLSVILESDYYFIS